MNGKKIKGFSLLELLAVLVIIGFAISIAVPFTQNLNKGLARHGAANTISSMIRLAQTRATAKNMTATVQFNQVTGTVQVVDSVGNQLGKTYLLTGGLRFPAAKSLNNITFSARGKITSTPVTPVYIEHLGKAGLYDRIDVTAETGQVVVVKNTNT
jgi:prepilin-type N-terminal cleavage/methylation domain-containing protein